MKVYRSIPKVKALTFDLDDTLYENGSVIRQVEQKAVQWLHQHHPVSLNWNATQWQALKIELLQTFPELRHDVTLWRHTQICQGLKFLGYDDPKAQSAADELIERVLQWRNNVSIPSESHDVLEQLSQSLPLVAITNGNVNVDAIGLSKYFSLVLKAGPDGRAKPFADMFLKAQQHLDMPACHILHVGDHVVTDVYGAKQHGFSACWYNDTGATSRQKDRLKLLPDIEVSSLSSLLHFI
jgi:putative hydrolase of the HAD superfamily